MASLKPAHPTSFKARLEVALRLLESKGIRRQTYYFSIYPLFWLLNIPIRPPIFAGFVFNCVFMSLAFGLLWGTIMWLLFWSHQGIRAHGDHDGGYAGSCRRRLLRNFYGASNAAQSSQAWLACMGGTLRRSRGFRLAG